FGDFSFPYELQDPGTIVSLSDHKFDDRESEHFSPQQGNVSSVHEQHDVSMRPAASDTSFNQRNGSQQRHHTPNPSDGSPQDTSPGGNSLEESVADEFGLHSTGRPESGEHGGKSKDDKSEMTPAWSELKTKAGKERKRLPLACIA